MSEEIAIEAKNIRKQIKDRELLKGISLTVPRGKVYGISGHNGSGKSLFLRILTGLSLPTSGTISIFGQQLGKQIEFAPKTGFLIDGPGFLPYSSGLENLRLLAMIRNEISAEQIESTIRRVGLDPKSLKPVRVYSSGMKQRLGLAQAMMENPDLLLLDEPTNALDKEGRKIVYDIIGELKVAGKTVVMTTHHAEELVALCDATFLMDEGELIQQS